jgi:hypothetical protein
MLAKRRGNCETLIDMVDRPLRRAMLNKCGCAAKLTSSKGLLDPPLFPADLPAFV